MIDPSDPRIADLFERPGGETGPYEKRTVYDPDGAAAGWALTARIAPDRCRECFFDPEDHLISIKDAERPDELAGPHGPLGPDYESGALMLKRFDPSGNLTEWKEWHYLPSDGLGWDWYMVEYDAEGNVIDDEYTGQA